MNRDVEPTDIVEFYPNHIFATSAARSEASDHNEVVITGTQFTRTVYRPYSGPDVLFQQSVAAQKTYKHVVDLRSFALGSEENFRQLITEREPPADRRFQPPSLNHLWSWRDVAAAVVEYAVLEYGLRGIDFDYNDDSDITMVWGEEARGSLYIVNQGEGWGPGHDIADIDTDDLEDCALCEKNFVFRDAATDPIRYLIRFSCPHVFHRHCLLPFLWSNRSKEDYFQCPSCSGAI